MTDLGYALCFLALLIIARFAFKDARKADEDEAKLTEGK